MSATVEPGTEFKVTVLPYFESDNPSITIYSYDANLNIIDVSNKKTIDYASNSTSMNYFYAMVSPV